MEISERNETGREARRIPKQKRAREKYYAILDASIVVLARDGYQGATTSNIAQESGVAVGSLYEYFPNKESIFAAYLDEHIRDIVELLNKNLDEQSSDNDKEFNPVESLRAWLTTIVEATESNKEILRIIISEVPGAIDLLSLEGIENQLLSAAKFLTDGLGLDEEQVKVRTYVLSNALYGFILRNLFSKNHLAVEETVDELIKLIVSYGSS